MVEPDILFSADGTDSTLKILLAALAVEPLLFHNWSFPMVLYSVAP
jgi:hypothetical protein